LHLYISQGPKSYDLTSSDYTEEQSGCHTEGTWCSAIVLSCFLPFSCYQKTFKYRNASVSIGSSCTPRQDLPPLRRRNQQKSFVLDGDGKLKYPPKVRRVQVEEMEVEQIKEPPAPGIIKLHVSFTVTYHKYVNSSLCYYL